MTAPENNDEHVGDRFWLAYGARLMSGTIPEMNAQAARLSTAAAWFWGLYVAVATSLSLLAPETRTVLVLLPLLTIMCAYVSAVRAQSPVMVAFDPRSPELVAEARIRIIKVKRFRLRLTYALLITSAAAIVIAAVAAW